MLNDKKTTTNVCFGGCILFLQVETEQWYAALMHRAYTSLVSFGSSAKFWPQDGPIQPDLHKSARL